jgi:predicted restriction endonuclease
LHDAAFDAGLITLDGKLAVVLSKRLKSYYPQAALEQNFMPFEGRRVRGPQMIAEPAAEFLDYHRTAVFKD